METFILEYLRNYWWTIMIIKAEDKEEAVKLLTEKFVEEEYDEYNGYLSIKPYCNENIIPNCEECEEYFKAGDIENFIRCEIRELKDHEIIVIGEGD